MSHQNLSLLERFNKWFTAPVMIMLTALTTAGGFIISTNSAKLNDLKTKVDTELEQKEFNNSLKGDLLAQVKDAINTKPQDTSIMRLTLLYINTLLTDSADSLFKEGLKTILLSTNKDLLSTQRTIDTFKNIQSYLISNNGRFNVDIFYLDDNRTEAMQSAESIAAKLRQKYPGDFNVRVRNMPSYINAQSAYRLDGNTLRYDKADSGQANKIYNLIVDSNLLPNHKPVMESTIHRVPDYLSVYVKNK